MTTCTGMLRSVSVWGTVATSSRAARLARAQVNPTISRLDALFANSLLRLFNISDPIDMNAYLCRHSTSIQFADDSPLASVDNLIPDTAADRILKLALRNYQRPALHLSRRHKTIACQCFGK